MKTVSLLQPEASQARTSCGEPYAKKRRRGQAEHDTMEDGGSPVSDSKSREEGEGAGQSLCFIWSE